MTNSTVASPMRSAASLRKTNKPLMEKRRRARINDSLTQLKSLVITGTKKDSSQFNKLEKADILELTVKHLRNLQNHQQQLQQHQQQLASGSDASVGPKYQDGFVECANEVIRYLGQSQGFSDDTKCRVINHLASCIQLANNKANFAKVMQAQTGAAAINAANTTAAIIGGHISTAAAAPVAANGQLIQIVSTPFQAAPMTSSKTQNVQILPSPSTAGVNNNNNMAVSAIPSSSSSALSTIAVQKLSAPHYTQPLHIQIPPAFSPVLVATPKKQPPPASSRTLSQKHSQQPYQPMDTSVASNNPTATNSNGAGSARKSRVKMEEPTSNSAAHLTSCSPAEQHQQHVQETPITHVHKIHGFYSSADDFVPSRPRSYSSTSLSSSSSSSSTENDLASPLNLTQSPVSRPLKPRHFMDKNNNLNLYASGPGSDVSTSSDQENIYSSITPSSHSNSVSGIKMRSFSQPIECGSSHHPFTPVMINGRKADLEAPSMKYMSVVMDEDRQCTRNQGLRSRSTSPASSVGEDRLWRPW